MNWMSPQNPSKYVCKIFSRAFFLVRFFLSIFKFFCDGPLLDGKTTASTKSPFTMLENLQDMVKSDSCSYLLIFGCKISLNGKKIAPKKIL